MSITASTAKATEKTGARGYFKVTRTGPTTTLLKVNYTIGGSATNGTDCARLSGVVWIPAGKTSATISVIPVKDSNAEGQETVIATLAAGAHYHVGDPASATVTIYDK